MDLWIAETSKYAALSVYQFCKSDADEMVVMGPLVRDGPDEEWRVR